MSLKTTIASLSGSSISVLMLGFLVVMIALMSFMVAEARRRVYAIVSKGLYSYRIQDCVLITALKHPTVRL